MNRPPFGLCLPVEFHRCRDGDTVEVGIANSRWVWAIRLMDCWCPEMSQPGGREAKQFAEKLMSQCPHPSLYIPMPAEIHNILASLTFDRIPGYIYLNSEKTLNEMMVVAGHALKSKQVKKS